MNSRLPVENRFCVKWSAELRREQGYSASSAFFSFRNELYYFQLYFTPEEDFEVILFRLDNAKNSQRKKKKIVTDWFRPLAITVLLEYYEDDKETVAYYATLSSSKYVFTIPGVVCDFQECYGRSDVANFVCFLQDTESLEVQNNQETKDLLTRVNSTSDLEELSIDLGNLLENKTLPDVRLKYGKDRTVPAHKALLAARSKVFTAMFSSKMTESQTGVVDLGDMEEDVIEAFLQYIYSGIFPSDLSNGIVSELYSLADKYDVCSLSERCRRQILNNLSEDNCVGYLVLADTHSDLAFKHSVINFICTNEALLKSETWLKFSRNPSPLAIEVYEKYVDQKCAKDATK